VGKPLLGGPFDLVDMNGRQVTEKTFFGRYTLLYFGFTHCPDICPTELHKMQRALDILEQFSDIRDLGQVGQVIPIFISVDPKRDTPDRLRKYSKEFHPRTVWLTGSHENLARVAKSFRMYYSKPPADSDDYQVDHSIFFFLVSPDGKFMEYFGKNMNAEEVANKMRQVLITDKTERQQRGEWPPNAKLIKEQAEQRAKSQAAPAAAGSR